MIQKVKKHLELLNEINDQRQFWLRISAIIYSITILLIVSWSLIDRLHITVIWWGIISTILILCMAWWYWTMSIVRKLMCHQKESVDRITELIIDIKEVREDVKNLMSNNE